MPVFYSNAVLQVNSIALAGFDGQHSAMLKESHIARKVAWMLKEGGVKRTQLMDAFGISTSAVSEWKRTGRIEKERLPVLANLSATRVSWWLSATAPVPPTAQWLVQEGQGEESTGDIPSTDLSAVEIKALQAFRGMSPHQQQAVIAAMERISADNLESARSLLTLNSVEDRAAETEPSPRRERPPLQPYPEPFASAPKPPPKPAQWPPPRRERPPLQPYPEPFASQMREQAEVRRARSKRSK